MLTERQTRHIDLHLPKSWNHCTTEELEHIAAAIIYEQQRQDRYHSFDWDIVKINIVFAINHLQVVSEPVPVVKDLSHDDTYLLRRSKKEAPWPIKIGQLHNLCQRLSWLSDNKAEPLFVFPYSELTFRKHLFSIIHVQGPPPLLDGYSWQEYRWLTDWMQEYMRLSNAKRNASEAQKQFLAILFKPKGETFNVQCSMFNDFDPVKWQVILFWWSALMLQLAKKFPHVFKQQPLEKGKRQRQQKADTPWDFYNSVTASVQKYIGGLSEQDVNSASYGTILQQLEMMAKESEELEKINKNHKK